MNRFGDILGFFADRSGFVSGASIASGLGISRTAVWKNLKQLEQIGYTFDQRRGLGYRLKEAPDKLYPWEIARRLKSGNLGRKILYMDSVDSTNAEAFKLAISGEEEGACVVAESQDSGRGRLQRQWHSPYGRNLYLSIILRPDIHPSKVYPLTFISSLAAYDTLSASGVEPRLKWPNDVLIGSRKICGTLIELSTEADRVRFVVVGVGLNINMEAGEMDSTIRDTATSLFIETKNRFERAAVCGMLLTNLEKYYETSRRQGMDEVCRLWEERAKTKGAYMEVRHFDRIYRGISQGIDGDGALLLRDNDVVTRVIAGDVTS
jgi:BirA family biotin operon repressor/biotin-[acetyl-CoA-carboxylase] ligase